MMNYIWGYILIFSIIFGLITNKLDIITNSLFNSSQKAIELSITMLGIMALWSGLMGILEKTSLINIIKKAISPLISFIFKTLDKTSSAYNYICLNFTANLLGLGNAATPLGLQAVKELDTNEKTKKLSLKLILINTAAIQLIPSTIIGIRAALNSENPSKIMIPIWICSIISFFTALFVYFLLNKRKDNNDY